MVRVIVYATVFLKIHSYFEVHTEIKQRILAKHIGKKKPITRFLSHRKFLQRKEYLYYLRIYLQNVANLKK